MYDSIRPPLALVKVPAELVSVLPEAKVSVPELVNVPELVTVLPDSLVSVAPVPFSNVTPAALFNELVLFMFA